MENLLAPIMSFKKLHVAGFVKEQFELEGIECFLTDEGFEVTDDSDPKGFKIKVGLKDTEKAIQILLRIHKDHDLDKIRQDSSIKGKRKILVPVDISNYDSNLLEYAFGIALKTDAELKLLHVYKDPSLSGPTKHTTSWELHEKIEAAEAYNKAQSRMLKFRTEVKDVIDRETRNKTKMHFALLRGRPENVIIAICKRYKPDLVIMSPKGKDEKKGAFMSSVTTSVIEHGNTPVMTIPKSARYKGMELINIMYATDFYDADNTSLNTLLDIVKPYDPKIHCIHIDIESDGMKQAKVDDLNQLLKKEYSHQQIECKLFESSDVTKGFEDFVKKNNIDLISFSSPKRTMFYKIFHPNLLKKMVSTTKIPMLVFPVP
jgi:nucleotide-binding universal stress UspA family protein